MEINAILSSLYRYKKEEYRSVFLDDVIYYFKSRLSDKFIHSIKNNDLELSGIHIHLLYNDMYHYVSHSSKGCTVSALQTRADDSVAYRLLNFTADENAKLNYFISSDDFNICSAFQDGKSVHKPQWKYLLISDKALEHVQPIKKETCFFLLGIESLNFLKKQNINHYCELFKKIDQSYLKLDLYRKKLETLPWNVRDRILIHSGLIYQFLGTIYTNDVDLIILAKDDDKINFEEYFKEFDNSSIIYSDINRMRYPYKKEWFTYKLMQMSGIDDIYTLLINPKYHFYFKGIKCISIDVNIRKTMNRSYFLSFIDIYMLKVINNIDYLQEFCLKNIAIAQGKALVRTDQDLSTDKEKIRNLIREWYNIDIPRAVLDEHYNFCVEKDKTIYKASTMYVDPDIKTQIHLHRKISQLYIKKYARDSLLDLGSGRLSGAYIYEQSGIQVVYGVEPSEFSYRDSLEIAQKYNRVKFNLIKSRADIDSLPKTIGRTFDTITLIFTIHYMLPNIDILVDNITRMSKPGTIVIITFINGDKIFDAFQRSSRVEVKYYNDIMWGAYKIPDDPSSAIFYMKDTYGLESGSRERLVQFGLLRQKFHRFEIVSRTNFLHEYAAIRLKTFQKSILSYHDLLVLKFIG